MIERAEAGGARPARKKRVRNYEVVADLVVERVKKSNGRITAKRLLPAARTAGYTGSARNFRRLVATAKKDWRAEHHRGRRPAIWSPGEHLVIDWGSQGGVHVFCAVRAWSRWRWRFAADEKSATTLGILGECFAELGGTPQVVLADRMGCLKGGVVANRVIPTGDYVRFALHYRFGPDFCEAADPESKGIVENLVWYAKSDLLIPLLLSLDDLREFPVGARRECGYQLDRVQHGFDSSDWKPKATAGGGVREIRVREQGGAFRVIYVAKLADRVCVLHCFHKRTQQTAKADLDLAGKRYTQVVAEVQDRTGKRT